MKFFLEVETPESKNSDHYMILVYKLILEDNDDWMWIFLSN